MPCNTDIIVAGAGLAGVCSALWLSEKHSVLLIDGAEPGASSTASGLVNPFAGMRARPIWHAQAALSDCEMTLEQAGASSCYVPSGILRPAASGSQARHYQSAAAASPDHFTWLSPGAASERWPSITANHGMLITSGGWMDVPRFLDSAMRMLKATGCGVQRGVMIQSWGESRGEAYVTLDSGDRLWAQLVILALGFGYKAFSQLRELRLHSVKGQVIQVNPADGLRLNQPVCGQGYVVPGNRYLTLGTTYERGFTHNQPTAAATQSIIELTSKMIPAISTCQVIHESAAVRVGVPGTRLPMLGAIGAQTWVFTGLGSKGLLFAPHIAHCLPQYLADPSRIPPEIRVR